MTVLTKIRKQGGAAVVTIPPAVLKMLGADVGSQLSLAVSDGSLVATPVQPEKRRYTLAELLEGADEMAELNAANSGWNNVAPVGNEKF